MPADASGFLVGWLAATYPGRLGWLLNACCWRQDPKVQMPYGVDNGKYGAFTNKRPWDEAGFYKRLEWLKLHPHKPLWVVVPDEVGDREATLRNWFAHSPRIGAMGFKLAMAVQDGMTRDDIPPNCDVVFVGGTDAFKMRSLPEWKGLRFHVGRINGIKGLWEAHEAGAESCDGTGWFRGRKAQLDELLRYLDESINGRQQATLSLA